MKVLSTPKRTRTPEQKTAKAAYMKLWYAENKNRLVEQKKLYYAKNPEKKALHLERQRQWHKARYVRKTDTIRRPNQNKGTGNQKYDTYRYAAQTRNLRFDLNTDDFNTLLSSDCHYCSKPLANGVDRIDNDKGYYSFNVVPCCWPCNRMKANLTYQEFLAHITRISENFSQISS